MAYIKKIWKDYPDATTPILAEDLNNIENGIEAVDTALENIENNVNNIEDGLETVTNNVNNGWISLNGTFTYSSANSPTFVVTTSVDLTGIVGLGMRIKLTQATTQYFIVTAITNGSITMYGGTDYTLTNASISNVYYSMLKAPYGFPMDPKKWTLELNSVARVAQTSPTKDTWYNLGGLSILLPVGIWDTYYQAETQHQRETAGIPLVYCALSTNASSVSDNDLKTQGFVSSVSICALTLSTRKTITVTTPTTFYLIASTNQYGATELAFRGEMTPTIVRATCAYL